MKDKNFITEIDTYCDGRRVSDGRLSFSDIESKKDDDVIAALIECPGIDRWTAEMFLIFGLKRLDVLSLGDAGLQRAVRLLYGNGKDVTGLLASIADVWRPYRSVGWLLVFVAESWVMDRSRGIFLNIQEP